MSYLGTSQGAEVKAELVTVQDSLRLYMSNQKFPFLSAITSTTAHLNIPHRLIQIRKLEKLGEGRRGGKQLTPQEAECFPVFHVHCISSRGQCGDRNQSKQWLLFQLPPPPEKCTWKSQPRSENCFLASLHMEQMKIQECNFKMPLTTASMESSYPPSLHLTIHIPRSPSFSCLHKQRCGRENK